MNNTPSACKEFTLLLAGGGGRWGRESIINYNKGNIFNSDASTIISKEDEIHIDGNDEAKFLGKDGF